jgi:hypothetical protein
MTFRTKCWIFVGSVLFADLVVAQLAVYGDTPEDRTENLLIGLFLVQSFAAIIALVGLYAHYKVNDFLTGCWGITSRKKKLALFVLLGLVYFVNLLRFIENVSESATGWHWYHLIGLFEGLALSTVMFYFAYRLLQRAKDKDDER